MTKKLRTVPLAMLFIISVDSIRNVPSMAAFGESLPFFFIMAVVLFLLPTALVSSELASTFQYREHYNGIYAWSKEAFGPRIGFVAVFLQWLENIVWYPLIIAFIITMLCKSLAIFSDVEKHDTVMYVATCIVFIFFSWLNTLSLGTSFWFSRISTILGVFLPFSYLILAGCWYVYSGHTLQLQYNHFIPNLQHANILPVLSAIMISFCGIEISTVFSEQVQNPSTTYPKACLLAALVITVSMLLASMSMSIVIPSKEASLLSGLDQTFAFYNQQMSHPIPYLSNILSIGCVFGAMGIVNSWILGTARNIQITLDDLQIYEWLRKKNVNNMPINLLIGQVFLVIILTAFFIFMPSVKDAFWFLSSLVVEIYMIVYMILFASFLKLRYKSAAVTKNTNVFVIPGGRLIAVLLFLCGMVSAIVTIWAGMEKPDFVTISQTSYALCNIASLVFSICLAFMIYKKSDKFV
jgi:glutamate:GABA antiporter